MCCCGCCCWWWVREFDECIKECDSSMVKLYDHVHAEAATPLMDVLTSVPFLRYHLPPHA